METVSQTRFQRWEAGLPEIPDVIDERSLDICLMKPGRRKVQRGGHLQFENLTYRGEYLAGYAGETVSLRFDPNDIITLLVYRQEKHQDVFLARAYALGLETEQLSLQEARAKSRRRRDAGKTLSNKAIHQEELQPDASARGNKNRKQRQKEEQKMARAQPDQPTELPVSSTVEAELTQTQPETKADFDSIAFEPIDFDELRGGW